MDKSIDDRGRGARMARRRRGPEGSILDGCDPRTGTGNEASRDGSAARTIELSIRGPLDQAFFDWIDNTFSEDPHGDFPEITDSYA